MMAVMGLMLKSMPTRICALGKGSSSATLCSRSKCEVHASMQRLKGPFKFLSISLTVHFAAQRSQFVGSDVPPVLCFIKKSLPIDPCLGSNVKFVKVIKPGRCADEKRRTSVVGQHRANHHRPNFSVHESKFVEHNVIQAYTTE